MCTTEMVNVIASYSTTACARFIALTPKPSFASISTRTNTAVGTVPTYNAVGGPNGKGHVSFDSAVSLIGGVHRQLDALKEVNAQNPETVYLFASHDGFAEPRPQSGGTPPATDLASTVAALVARHQNSVSESAPIDYFALAAPPAAPEPEALAADSGLMPQPVPVS